VGEENKQDYLTTREGLEITNSEMILAAEKIANVSEA